MCATYNFPLSKMPRIENVIQECMSWILCLPHTNFKPDDINRVNPDNNFELSNLQEHIIFSKPQVENTSLSSLTYHKMSPTYNLTIRIETRVDKSQLWIKFCSLEAVKELPTQLPRLNNSSLTIRLVSQFGGGLDGELPIEIAPITLKDTEADRKIAHSIFDQKLSCSLPIIYISASEKDKYAVIPDRLARSLCGLAHIVIEPSRLFSRKLRCVVDSRNIYGGIVGIYWPNGVGATLFRRGSQDVKGFERSIIDEVFRDASTRDGKKAEGVHFKQNI
ncbi:hypothetical protein [Pseudomonas sp. MHK4]